jgi:hypothetical protein
VEKKKVRPNRIPTLKSRKIFEANKRAQSSKKSEAISNAKTQNVGEKSHRAKFGKETG